MTNDGSGATLVTPNRPRIVDVVSQQKTRHKRRHNNRPDRQEKHTGEQPAQHYTVEMQPILREIMTFSRRTHALGTHVATSVISDVVAQIRALNISSPKLDDVLLAAEERVAALNQQSSAVYE